jgi:hypothetical protein
MIEFNCVLLRSNDPTSKEVADYSKSLSKHLDGKKVMVYSCDMVPILIPKESMPQVVKIISKFRYMVMPW